MKCSTRADKHTRAHKCNNATILGWVFLLISPLLSICILCVATGTNLFNLDAWNTTWNDEGEYYKIPLTIINYGTPQGVAGYNEVPAPIFAYSAHVPSTYLPYLLSSLFLPLFQHNYIIEALAYMNHSLAEWGWQGLMMLWFLVCIILGFILAIVNTSDRTTRIVVITLIATAVMMFEANFLIYSVNQMHRMLLAINVFMSIVLLSLPHMHSHIPQYSFTIICSMLFCLSFLSSTQGYALPQVSDAHSKESDYITSDTLVNEMPRTDNPWQNTIATSIETEDLYVYFLLPSYICCNTCTTDYLRAAITDGSLNSEYLCVVEDSELDLFAANHYQLLCNELNHKIYLTHN